MWLTKEVFRRHLCESLDGRVVILRIPPSGNRDRAASLRPIHRFAGEWQGRFGVAGHRAIAVLNQPKPARYTTACQGLLDPLAPIGY